MLFFFGLLLFPCDKNVEDAILYGSTANLHSFGISIMELRVENNVPTAESAKHDPACLPKFASFLEVWSQQCVSKKKRRNLLSIIVPPPYDIHYVVRCRSSG